MASDPHAAVLEALPHRPPFLFVDRIIERTPSSIITEWYVPPDLECFKGHYPGHPVLPGVIEALGRGGSHIVNMKVSTPSLEDVFIHLTGKALRD